MACGARAKRSAISAGDFKQRWALRNSRPGAAATVTAVAQGRQHVAQRLPLRYVIVHVAGGRQRQGVTPRQADEALQLPPVVAAVVQLGQQIAAIAEQIAVSGKGPRRSPLPLGEG